VVWNFRRVGRKIQGRKMEKFFCPCSSVISKRLTVLRPGEPAAAGTAAPGVHDDRMRPCRFPV
jgi:hypothetical protein